MQSCAVCMIIFKLRNIIYSGRPAIGVIIHRRSSIANYTPETSLYISASRRSSFAARTRGLYIHIRPYEQFARPVTCGSGSRVIFKPLRTTHPLGRTLYNNNLRTTTPPHSYVFMSVYRARMT